MSLRFHDYIWQPWTSLDVGKLAAFWHIDLASVSHNQARMCNTSRTQFSICSLASGFTGCFDIKNKNPGNASKKEGIAREVRIFSLMLQRCQKHGVKLSPHKCDAFKCQVTFQGHMVSEQGYAMDLVEITPL